MSRAQKNARRGQSTSVPGDSGQANRYPGELTQGDGSRNIAGDVTRKSNDVLYQQENVVSEDYD